MLCRQLFLLFVSPLILVSGNENGVFAISDWRHLLVVKNIDYEVQQRYELVVRVQDSADPPHHSESTIIITVEDRNDNAPGM